MNYGTSYGMSMNNSYGGQPAYSSVSDSYNNSYSAPQHDYNTFTQADVPDFSVADVFLEENRPATPIVTDSGSILGIIQETFQTMTGYQLPRDMSIIILDDEQFKQAHSAYGRWSEGIMGFSINRIGKGISDVFVRQDHLDSMLLTIGHEIGHVMSPTLPNKHDEEAKAHAFSLAWIETIRDNNIAGLRPNIKLNPAKNGLHDVSLNFVMDLLKAGNTSFTIFKTLATGLTSLLR